MFGFRKTPGKGAAKRDARAMQQARSAELGVALVALRLRGDERLPDGCVELVFDAAGRARRAPARYAGAGETACAYHPGPYETAFAPFAGAPEIGLRLRYVADAADPRVAQQRFELFLYSEGGDALAVDALHGAIAGAVRNALAQGRLDLPACTTLDEWHAFRAGINELLYTRFGLTVDDCVPVDLADLCDYAAILRGRMAQGAVPVMPGAVAEAAVEKSGVAAGLAGATTGKTATGATSAYAATAAAASSAMKAAGSAVASAKETVTDAAPAASASTEGNAAGTVTAATGEMAAMASPSVDAALAAASNTATAAKAGTSAPEADTVTTAATSAAVPAEPATSATAATDAVSEASQAPPALPAAALTAHALEPQQGAAAPFAGARSEPVLGEPLASLDHTRTMDNAVRAGLPAMDEAGPIRTGLGQDPATADGHALRRLFLELPAWSAGIRALALPEGQTLFTARRDVLQRCALAALDVNTMPSLAWAAPDRQLAKQGQTRRASHSVAAVQVLDEAWALLAQWQLAAATRATAEVHMGLLDEADRLAANLAFHLAARRATAGESWPDGERKEPQW